MDRLRKMAVTLTVLEARYLPKLDPEFVHLNNADVEGWERYRKQFDPVQMQGWLQYPSAQVRGDAEDLLSGANRIDPVGADWSRSWREPAPSIP